MSSWTESTSARERIEEIALRLRQPRSVNWVKEQAAVGSWGTTKSQLDQLVNLGKIKTITVNGETRYAPDPMHEYLDHIRELVTDHTKDELRDELERIAAETEAWKTEYEVQSLAELEASLATDDREPAEVGERRKTIAYWEENDQYRQLIAHALHLYDDLITTDSFEPAQA